MERTNKGELQAAATLGLCGWEGVVWQMQVDSKWAPVQYRRFLFQQETAELRAKWVGNSTQKNKTGKDLLESN